FAELYNSMQAQLPTPTLILIAIGTTARGYVLFGFGILVAADIALRDWGKTPRGKEAFDRALLKVPVLGEVWLKYQVAQFSRVLSTLRLGGSPLHHAVGTPAALTGL